MKETYPIIVTSGEPFLVVSIPDFQINTQGRNIPEAIEMAQDAIGIVGIDMQDCGEALPKASALAEIQASAPTDATVLLVEVDFEAYRKSLAENGFTP